MKIIFETLKEMANKFGGSPSKDKNVFSNVSIECLSCKYTEYVPDNYFEENESWKCPNCERVYKLVSGEAFIPDIGDVFSKLFWSAKFYSN